MAVRARPCLVSSWRINHFGMKPESGGRPPRERRMRGVMAVRAGVLAHEVARVLMFVDLLILNTIKVEKVMTKYMISVSKVREGEN